MKRTLLTIAILMFCFGNIQAQSYHIYDVKRNDAQKYQSINPGYLNTESDDAAEGEGWKRIDWDTLNKGYALVDSIPFPFQFKGASKNSFRCTKNGVLSFDWTGFPKVDKAVTDVTSPNLPNQSVVIGGILAKGENDRIVTKMFGTAPHRQYWVKFHSFTVAADTSDKFGTYAYHAVVFDEGSNQIHLVQMAWGSEFAWYKDSVPVKLKNAMGLHIGPFESYSITALDDAYNGHQLKDKKFTNNSFYSFAPGKVKSTDASLSQGFNNYRNGTFYVKAGSSSYLPLALVYTFHGDVAGTDNHAIYVQINNETPLKYDLNALSAQDYRTGLLVPSILRNTVAGDYIKIRAWTGLNSGGADENPANDTCTTIFKYIAQNQYEITKGPLLIEFYTATWCPTCPILRNYIDSMKLNENSFNIIVEHHVNDYMNNPLAPGTYDSLPFLIINREYNPIAQGVKPADLAKQIGVQAKVNYQLVNMKFESMQFNQATGKITGKLTATMADYHAKSTLRLGVMLKERDVRGLGSGWDQRVDVTATLDSQSIFFQKNKTLSGYHHDNVVWNVAGGKHGKNGFGVADEVIPSGSTVSYDFTLTVPDTILSLGIPNAADFGPYGAVKARYKPADYSVVGFAADDWSAGISETVNNGNFGSAIISAIEQKVWNVRASSQSVNQAVPFVLYPNPAADQVHIQIEANIHSVTVLDLMGRVVKNNGSESTIDLTGMSAGTYLVRIKTPQGEGVSRLIVQ